MEITGSFTANEDTPYKVEFYYQSADETYPTEPTDTDDRTGTTDTTASVTDEDKVPTKNSYVFDEAADNVLSGNIAGDGSLVLKVYFKLKNGPLDPEKTTPAVESNYKLGDMIPFTIKVTNVSVTAAENITVVDPNAEILSGTGYTVTDGKAIIATLAAGATVEISAQHEVTEEDILAGTVGNKATVSYNGKDQDVEASTDMIDGLDVTLTVNKTISNTPADGKAYKLGETIEYKITVTNEGNVAYSNVVVKDELTGLEQTIETLAVGATETITTEKHVVTEADILAGEVVNTVTAEGDPIKDPKTGEEKTPKGEDTVKTGDADDPDGPTPPIEDLDVTLTVNKTISNTPADGKAYKLGETIEYKITVTNEGNVAYSNVVVKDELTGLEQTIETLAVGATETITTEKHVVTEADILAGEVVNTVTAEGDPIKDPKTGEEKTPKGEDTVKTGDADDPDGPTPPVEPKNGHLTVVKETTSETPEGSYKLGDKVSYKITVTNDGNLTITDITVTDERTELSEHIDSLEPGASKEYTTETTVTEEDILSGHIINDATAKGTSPDPDKPDVPVTPGHTDDDPEEKNGHLTIKKVTTSKPENGETYALGETITYRITATNDGNLTLTDITVDDELTGASWEVKTLAPGLSESFTTSYTVTEEDILAGEVLNVATGKGKSPDPDKPDVPVTPGEDPEPTDDLNTTLSVNKKITNKPAEGEAFKLGETIKYSITVKNEGNVPYYNVVVKDELTKLDETIEVLAVGEEKTFNTEYVVTEADILKGEVTNTATAKADPIDDPKDPENPKTPEGEDTTTTGDEDDPDGPTPPVDEKNGHLTIEKVTTSTPAEGDTYALGETIEYKITVKNDGNLTITDITVTDELTKDEWTIDSLAPDAEEVFEAAYTVTEDDILKGEVVNVATGKGTSPDPDKPDVPVTPGEDPEPTDDLDTTLSVNKKITNKPADGKAFKLGETIKYSITVKNEGNVPYYNVAVKDELTKLDETIEVLKVGEEKTFNTEYVVTEADILKGEVTNTATAKGDPIDDPKDPENPKTPEGEDTTKTGDEDDPDGPTPPVEDLDTTLTVNKKVTNAPADGVAYKLGETITYEITVKNDGNATYYNVVVEDELTGLNETIESLAVGAERTFTTTYVVTEADILAGEVVNTATAKGDPIPDPKDPENPKTPEGQDTTRTGDEDDPDGPVPPVDNSVTLTVRYFYEGANTPFRTFERTYTAGDAYNVRSPRVAGYTPDQARVRGTIVRDTVIDVYYTINQHTLTIQYVYVGGGMAAPTYTATLDFGDGYSVTSPAIAGYTISDTVVTGTMGDQDVTITVYYAAVQNPWVLIDDYGTPLGFNGLTLNAGDCVE